MHSAFLQTADGWTFTDNPRLVLEHDGDLLVNADSEEKEAHLAELALREGGESAILWSGKVVVTASPLHRYAEDALAEATKFGTALFMSNSYWSTVDSQEYIYSHPTWDKDHEEKTKRFHGFVVVPEGPFWRLRHDPELWASVNEKKTQKARKEWLAEQRKPINRWDFENLADKCSYAVGAGGTKSFRIEQLWIFLAAHDAAFGKRATNKLALLAARKWCRNREKSRKWLRRWTGDETVRRTDERLAAVCRKSTKTA
jgi:hypothetical protein